MRDLICASLAGAMALAAWGHALAKPQEAPKPGPEARAQAAEAHGVRASFRTEAERGAGKGYSARSRRMEACLASYPGYDPAIDRIRVRPGVTRRCEG